MARETNKRKVCNNFYIITNGEQTEINYFKLLKLNKSIYNVKLKFIHGDPLTLVNKSIDFLKDANQLWVVFDVDASYNEGKLIPALKLANDYGINVAYSNIAFEVWLISHFEKCEKYMAMKDLKLIIDKYLFSKNLNIKYTKNDIDLLSKYFIPYYKTAIVNAKIIYQKRVAEHNKTYNNTNYKIWE